jgi:hypothetical protein
VKKVIKDEVRQDLTFTDSEIPTSEFNTFFVLVLVTLSRVNVVCLRFSRQTLFKNLRETMPVITLKLFVLLRKLCKKKY